MRKGIIELWVSPGIYDIRVKGLTTLKNIVRNMVVAPPSPVSVNPGTLIEGDTNYDNIVDEIDYSMILLHFGQSAGTMESPTSAATCDFNGDGWVDEIDYSIILMTFGQYGVDIE